MSAAMGFFLLGTRERVRNSRSKRAINVRVTEVLLYLYLFGEQLELLKFYYTYTCMASNSSH